METGEQQTLRSKIMTIQRDTSLTPQQKSRSIQQLMMGNFQQNDSNNAEEKEKEKVVTLNKAITYHNETEKIYGCKHYIKNCKIKAVCCGQLFTCRRCHDEEISYHKINRYLIEDMMCFLCSTVQPVSNECENCKVKMAHYFCSKCKFFDGNENKHIWHCDQCGLCRVGAKDSYEHCDQCHTCMPKGHKQHVDRVLDCDCPICGENLFQSTLPCIFPEPCQHVIHSKCRNKYLRSGKFSCPICSKTYKDIDLSAYWEEIDRAIELAPVPEEYKDWKVEILCNDCNIKEVTPFHFYGNKCSTCKGYNTNIVATIRPDGRQEEDEDEEDTEVEDQQQQQ